jgi:hypothetical protein
VLRAGKDLEEVFGEGSCRIGGSGVEQRLSAAALCGVEVHAAAEALEERHAGPRHAREELIDEAGHEERDVDSGSGGQRQGSG